MISIIPSNTHWDFLGKRKIAISISLILIVLGLILMVAKGGPKYGIDFAGGVEMQIQMKSAINIADLRKAASASGVGDFSVQSYGDDEDNEFLLRVKQPDGMGIKEIVARVDKAMIEAFGDDGFEMRRQEFVGPKAGKELREKGMMAMMFAIMGILLYVALRFEFSYSIGAVAALIHDVLMVVSLYVLIGEEFDLQTVAALLTVVGYSLNDTIVVFDRIRETVGRRKRALLESTMNEAINNTLSRTLLTSFTTLLTVLALFIFSAKGSVIENFSIALLAGIIVGTYSSIFIASPVVLAYNNRKKKAK